MNLIKSVHGLFNPVVDRLQTQFAWGINYAPLEELSGAQCDKIAWHKKKVYKRDVFDLLLNSSKTTLALATGAAITEFEIHWKHNNVPTEQEWNARSTTAEIHCDFRISPCASGNGRVVVLSWN